MEIKENKCNVNLLFKVFATLVFLMASTEYTMVAYKFGVYVVATIGVILLFFNILKKNFSYKKIDVTILLFIVGFIVTIIINNSSGIFKQGFVLLCVLMYFFVFFSSDLAKKENIFKENRIIMMIVVIFTFICLICSYILLIIDLKNNTNHTYNLHGGNSFQFIGLYTGISTQAMMSGISALISLYFVYSEIKIKNNKKFFLIFNIINFILQDFALTLSYTSASIVAFGCALCVGIFLMFNNSSNDGRCIKLVIYLALAILISAINYCVMDYTSRTIIDSAFNDNTTVNPNNQVISADDGSKELFSSNGRGEIWKEAISLWKDKPVFGNGYGTFYIKIPTEKSFIEYRNIHSGYIEVIYTCGLWGFITIMIFGGYYLIRFIKLAVTEKHIEFIGAAMIIVHSCMYASINQLFILDRSINMFLLCVFLGLARGIESKRRKE